MKKTGIELMLLIVICMTACGTTERKVGDGVSDTDIETEEVVPMEIEQPVDVTDMPEPFCEDPWIHVDNMGELVETIAPGAQIMLEPGSYDLWEYLWQIDYSDIDKWNSTHSYVEIQYDDSGHRTLVVKDVDGLSICGGGEEPSQTMILSEKPARTLLKFCDCNNITLTNMLIGCQDTLANSGNSYVLYFKDCEDIFLFSMELFGTYEEAIFMNGCSGVLKCSDCKINECEGRFVGGEDNSGEWSFYNCDLNGNGEEYISADVVVNKIYDHCNFTYPEPENIALLTDVQTYDCTWNDTPDQQDEGSDSPFEINDGFYESEIHRLDVDGDGQKEYVLTEETLRGTGVHNEGFQVAEKIGYEYILTTYEADKLLGMLSDRISYTYLPASCQVSICIENENQITYTGPVRDDLGGLTGVYWGPWMRIWIIDGKLYLYSHAAYGYEEISAPDFDYSVDVIAPIIVNEDSGIELGEISILKK